MKPIKVKDLEGYITQPAMLTALLDVLSEKGIIEDEEVMEKFEKHKKIMLKNKVKAYKDAGIKIKGL